MFNINQLNLNADEKSTFRLHLAYSITEGLLAGILLLNEFVFLKSMDGANGLLAFLFQISVILMIFSILFNEILKRTRNKKRLMLVFGVLTRLPLLLLLLFPTTHAELSGNLFYHWAFLAIFFVYYLATPVIFPITNQLLKVNYSHDNFGKLFSYATSVKKVITFMTTFMFGMLLDFDNFAFIYVYPVIGILGIFSIFLLTKIKYGDNPEVESYWRESLFAVTRESLRNMWRIIRTNKPYRDFEIGFMFYGFAFMVTSPIITIYFDEILEMNFSTNAMYKSYYNVLAIVLLPICGRLIGKIDIRKFAAYTYISMLFYLLFLALTEYFPWYFEVENVKIHILTLIAFTFFAFFTATMALLWSIGTAYFCRKEEAGHYQSVHLTLVGIRACFSPLLGVLLLGYMDFTGVFVVGIVALFLGVISMILSYRAYHFAKAKTSQDEDVINAAMETYSIRQSVLHTLSRFRKQLK